MRGLLFSSFSFCLVSLWITLSAAQHQGIYQRHASTPCDVATIVPLTDDEKATMRRGKIIVLCIVGFISFASSWLPWAMRRFEKYSAPILGVAVCFTAGIMLGAAFSHMIMHSIDGFRTYFAVTNPTFQYRNYPFGMLICIFTLILLILIDKLIVANGLPKGATHSQNHSHLNFELTSTKALEEKKPEDPQQQFDLETKEAVSKAFIFFVALSLHSIFDGLGVGAEDKMNGFQTLCIAVCAHKILDGFALGVPFYLAKISLLYCTIAFAFCAAMVPLGVGIGMAVQETVSGANGQLAQGIIIGMSAGSFIFIALVEMLPSGLATGPPTVKMLLLKMFSLTLGWAVMSVVSIWV